MTELLETKVGVESNLKGRTLLVKGYYITSEIEDFTPEEIAIHYINKFYYCPVCSKIKRGWAIYEEKVNGIFIRKFILECKHEFTTLKGLKILDIDYKDMLSMYIIFKADDKQLIQRARSIIRPFMFWLSHNRSPSITTYDAGGTWVWLSRVIGAGGSTHDVQGFTFASPTGNVDYGILLGLLDTPNNVNTFALAQRIPHGTAVGQLQYGTTTVSDLGVSGDTFIVTISRPFQNGSPGAVTVKEVALAFNIITPPRVTVNATLARDVLATPFDAAVGSTFTVYYRLLLTIS